jgi:16S rRNA (cytosine967-C5)-methyltransferase
MRGPRKDYCRIEEVRVTPDNLWSVAARVIEKTDRDHPADSVLRSELRTRGAASREDGRSISRAVFAYYRWREWLNWKEKRETQLQRAMELQEAFDRDPGTVPEDELRRAAPKWIAQFMEVTPEWLRSLQAEPLLWLRARPGQGRMLAEKLGDCRAAGGGALSDALRYDGTQDLFRTAEFRSGEFEVQDIASQIVGLVCDPKPGSTWWDACAGEGGKLLHLCDLMRGKGLVWASDRAAWRLDRLKQRAARARIFNYRSALWAANAKLPTRARFDGVLVDAPCSGVGTWQRNPHARWTAGPEDVRELAAVQKDLLTRAAETLKPGGRLVYSVCTMTRDETIGVCEAMAGPGNGLRPVTPSDLLGKGSVVGNQLWLWPQHTGGNGMFIAVWDKA